MTVRCAVREFLLARTRRGSAASYLIPLRDGERARIGRLPRFHRVIDRSPGELAGERKRVYPGDVTFRPNKGFTYIAKNSSFAA